MSDDSSVLNLPEPQPPTEVDYETIHDAVMETQRGRWFLHEYAKRNRHADTTILLAAIERLEALMRQPQEPPPAQQPQPQTRLAGLPPSGLRDAIERTRRNLAAIQTSGSDKPADFETIASSFKDSVARVRSAIGPLQDITYAMREEGTPDRFCNEIERRTTDLLRDCGDLEQAATGVRHVVVLLRDLANRIEAMEGGAAFTPPPAPAPEPAAVHPIRPAPFVAPTPAASAPERKLEDVAQAAPITAPVAEEAFTLIESIAELHIVGIGIVAEDASDDMDDIAPARMKAPAPAPVAIEPPAPPPIEPPAAATKPPATAPLDLGPLANTALAAVAEAAMEMAREAEAAPAGEQLQQREPEIAAAFGFEPVTIKKHTEIVVRAVQPQPVEQKTPEPLAPRDLAATESPQVSAPAPAADFISTPLADPAEFLLEPLPPAPAPSPAPAVAATPATVAPLAAVPAPTAAPRRDEALAPIIALSDEEKIALFS